jgi:hypothetical protein
VASAESAESFCAGLIKEIAKRQTEDCSKYANGSLEQMFCSWDDHLIIDKEAYYLGIDSSYLEPNLGNDFTLTSLIYEPSLKQQFQNCVGKKKQEQSDSTFLKYLDKY